MHNLAWGLRCHTEPDRGALSTWSRSWGRRWSRSPSLKRSWLRCRADADFAMGNQFRAIASIALNVPFGTASVAPVMLAGAYPSVWYVRAVCEFFDACCSSLCLTSPWFQLPRSLKRGDVQSLETWAWNKMKQILQRWGIVRKGKIYWVECTWWCLM